MKNSTNHNHTSVAPLAAECKQLTQFERTLEGGGMILIYIA